ncbi:MAG: peptide chain release factor N(5)-glutamine methyltransferase [Alphaproteobacteria bacterium]|nr:peptide chain release factor N(5)-glutamine methyltransferase [Alphaproteobacteria bacterium]
MLQSFQDVVTRLIAQKITNPILEARFLVAGALLKNPNEISSAMTFDAVTAKKIEVLLQRRLNHEPLDKILGQREFYKYNFVVNKDVLSPRPETEILVEQALKYLQHHPQTEILDLGTGSGCIIETLLAECPTAHGVAVDVSAAALRVAQRNAQQLGVSERIKFVEKNWFDWQFRLDQKFDLIVSNPPYIPSADILKLDTEVKDYDPLVALDGGMDGLASYRRIARLSVELLNDGGYILLEVGSGQADDVAKIFAKYLQVCGIVKDLAGISRCVIMQKPVA